MDNAKYLKVTIHDNDFWTSLSQIGDLLQEVFRFYGKFPTEEDFPILQKLIKHLWYATANIGKVLRNFQRGFEETPIDVFECDLEFVDYLNIPEWDNSESIYIPMFAGEIISR